MYHTTGFDREEIIDLCIRINSADSGTGAPGWPPCLGLFKSVAATLTYMRHNRTQSEIGESLGVSQPTISRAISAITPLIPEAVRDFVPTADDLDPDAQYILNGTLLPCWSWANTRDFRYFGPPGRLSFLCSVRAVVPVSGGRAGVASARVSRRGRRAVPRAAGPGRPGGVPPS